MRPDMPMQDEWTPRLTLLCIGYGILISISLGITIMAWVK